MARQDQAHPLSVAGEWFVDTRCISCDVARHWAPGLVAADADGRSYVLRQPEGEEEQAAMWRAAQACPTFSIGHRTLHRPASPVFPHELAPGVLAQGNNSEDSFGAHSYLVRAAAGTVMVDAPRWVRPLADRVEALGGVDHVLLTHRDDVADADRWAERFGARVWIHADDAGAAPYATDVVTGSDPVEVVDGVVVVPIPGHTRGSVAIHVEDRWLFTGDSLHWHVRRGTLDVFPGQTWYSWEHLSRSMDVLAVLRIEGVFPGHGMWHLLPPEVAAEQLAALGPRMRAVGRSAWGHRPAT